ncbi:mammalian ependymin-related protein 1-like [Oscarella lobularis]|uniref:mammalian ependymin-related protein 1-like n=1 Tax=Oscarella lobularis TaxID=121494 RepID=UPI0033135134
MLGFVIALVAIAGAVQACDFPPTWTAQAAHENFIEGSRDYLTISYDAANKRFSANGTYNVTRPDQNIVQVIGLYEERKYYVIEVAARRCTVHTIENEFKPWGVPEDARDNGEYVFGVATASLKLHCYSTRVESRLFPGLDLDWSVQVTEELCVPAIEQYLSVHDNERRELAGQVIYYDIAPTVEASQFVPPAFCNEDVVDDTRMVQGSHAHPRFPSEAFRFF